MSDFFWLTEAQIERLKPFFPKSRGKPRVDDRRVLSGMIHIQRNGLMWKHAPAAHGPPKTLYNRWKRWSRMGVFAVIMTELAAQARDTEMVMIDVEPGVRQGSENHWRGHLKTHRTASGLAVKKGGRTADNAHQERAELKVARPGRCKGSSDPHAPPSWTDPGSYRRAGVAAHDPSSGGIAGRPGLRGRLVPQRADRNGNFTVHPVQARPQGPNSTRCNALSPAPQDQKHVQPPQGLAQGRDPV